jgi:hypothetical protein
MAVQKNTNDLLTQASSTLPNNTTQQISPLDVREMAENLAASMFNKITDAPLVGLKAYSTLVTYESGQACTYLGAIYIANQVTGPGAFNAAHWTLFVSGSGTVNKLAKFSSTGGPVADSTITDNGTNYLFSLLNTNGFVKTSGGTGQLSVSAQVSVTEGGTGKSSWVAGSIPYISATNTFGEVAVGTNGHFLSLVAGVPTWAAISAPNLGSANLTSTDDARTFTLKSGGTASQNLQFLNSGGGNLLALKGNNTLDFGSSANYVNSNFYCNPATNTNFNVLRGTDVYIQSDVAAYTTYFRGSSWSQYIALAHNAGRIEAVGANAGFTTNNLVLRNDSTVNSFFSMNAAGVQTVRFDSPVNNFLMKDTRIGGVYTDPILAKFTVKGNGSTSATTTALFQNSSAVNSLKVRDDNYVVQRAINSAIADGDLANNEMSFYIDEGTNHCVVKVKYSSGTVKTGTFNLT